MIRLIVKGDEATARRAAEQRGLQLEAVYAISDRWIGACVDDEELDAVVQWLVSDKDQAVPGYGYADGSLLYYYLPDRPVGLTD